MEKIFDSLLLPGVGAIGLISALLIGRSILKNYEKSTPISIEESRLDLENQLKWLGIQGVINEGNLLVVFLEYWPSSEKLNFIPVVYKGYTVETRLSDDKDLIRLK